MSLPSLRSDLHLRVMLTHYLWFVFIVFFAILAVVTAIDVATDIQKVFATHTPDGVTATTEIVLRFLGYRLIDNASQVLPISVMVGLAWGEVVHETSGRVMTLRSLGLRSGLAMRPVAVVLVLSMAIQLFMSTVARPYAFMSLSQQNLGEYGLIYAEQRSEREWFAFGDTLFTAYIDEAEKASMTDWAAFSFAEDGRLEQLRVSPELEYLLASGDQWRALETRQIYLGFPNVADEAVIDGGQQASGAEKAIVHPNFSRLWLHYRYIEPKYVPFADLLRLSRAEGIPSTEPDYAPWVTLRLFEPVAFTLVSLLFFTTVHFLRHKVAFAVATVLAFSASYVGYFVVKAIGVFLAANIVAPGLTAFLVCLGLAALNLVLFRRTQTRRHEAP